MERMNRLILVSTTLLLLVLINQVQASVLMTVETRPVILGQDFVITCEATNCSFNNTKHWMGGVNHKVLAMDGRSINPKYSMKTNTETSFSLIIRNVSVEDLSYKYTCTCGFQLDERKVHMKPSEIIALPSRKMVNDNTRVQHDVLEVNFTLLNVSSEPACKVFFQDQDTDLKIKEQHYSNDTFKNLTYQEGIHILESGHHIFRVECMSLGYNVEIINKIIDCKIKEGYLSIPLILGICFGILISTGVIIACIKRVKSSHLHRKENENDGKPEVEPLQV